MKTKTHSQSIPAPLTKRAMAINIMRANTDQGMEVVVDLIARANQDTPSAARAYYRYLVDQNMAPGKVVEHVRAPRSPSKGDSKPAGKPVKAAEPITDPTKRIYRSRRERNPELHALIHGKKLANA